MKFNLLLKIILTGLFAAIIVVFTIVIPFPVPGAGYINIGDAFGLTAGIVLGPVFGAIAAGIGGALSDIILSYTIFAPATLVIKGLCALLAGLIYKALSKNNKSIFIIAITTIIAEIPMVLLYFLYEYFILDLKGGAIAEIGMNAVQGIVSALISVIFVKTLNTLKITERINKNERNI